MVSILQMTTVNFNGENSPIGIRGTQILDKPISKKSEL
jgi:hypothetical protein